MRLLLLCCAAAVAMAARPRGVAPAGTQHANTMQISMLQAREASGNALAPM